MTEYRLTPRAEQDLGALWRTIATDNEPAADALVLRLFDRFDLLARHPEIGVRRPDIAPDVRLSIEGSYVVLYEPTEFGVLIVAIVHGMRDLSGWLGA